MTTYYVGPGGSNAAAGTSYATRWLTVSKAVSGSGMASGDSVYVTPGIYRETVAPGITATTTTSIIGDVTGSHTSGVPGMVMITAFTTNDTTIGSSTSVLIPSTRDYLSWSNIVFVAGTTGSSYCDMWQGNETNWTFTDCTFIIGNGSNTSGAAGNCAVASNVPAHLLFNRCVFIPKVNHYAFSVGLNRHTADYDADVIFRNCLFFGGSQGLRINSSGSGVGFGGGVIVENCSFFGQTTGVAVIDSNISSTYPVIVRGCYFHTQIGVSVTSATTMAESYNFFACPTPRTTVSAGTGSVTDYADLMSFGQEAQWGANIRPALTPFDISPILGLGTAVAAPSVDFNSRPRPAGGGPYMGSVLNAAGAIERHDTGVKETANVSAGAAALKIVGPGDHDIQIPVDPYSTTISVNVYYDANHDVTTPPQATLLANAEIGYAGETVVAASTTAAWLTISFTPFTPTGKSYVTLRLQSRPAAGNGYAIFDSISIT